MKKCTTSFFLSIAILFCCLSSIAQEGYYDSILHISKTTKQDTTKARMLNILSEELWQIGEYKQSKVFAQEAFDLSEKKISVSSGSEKNLFLKQKANACNNIAIIDRFLGDYSDAIKNHLTALKIRIEIGDKKGQARSYLGIGTIYGFMHKYDEALEYKFKSKNMFEELNDSVGMAKVYNHIAFIFYDMGKYDSVPKYNNKALMIYLKSFNILGMADVYDLFGLTYMKTKEYNLAVENFNTCLQYRTMLVSKNDIAESNVYLGMVYSEMKQYKKAADYYNTALLMAKEVGTKEHIKNSYKGLVEVDSATHNYAAAFEHYKMYVVYRDSLVGQKTAESITQLQSQFENDKKEEIRALEAAQKEEKQHADEQKQRLILYSVSGGLVLVLILALVVYRGSKQKQKANMELLAKNEIIEKQKHIVEEKQKEIIDSINYAKRIQQSQLPTEKYITKSINRLKKG